MTDEVSARVRRFRAELEDVRKREIRMARWNYRGAYMLMIIAVASSAAAGILGLGFAVDQQVVSLLALIPALAVTIASQLRWQDKSNLHYRKWAAAKAHLRCLDYELPCAPSEAQLAELSRSYSAIEAQLDAVREGIRWSTKADDAAAKNG